MKQTLAYFMAVILWGVALALFFNGTARWLFLGLAALHFVELLAIGYRSGRRYGYPAWRSILMSMLFGIIWWKPLRVKMAKDDLTEDDFIEDGKEPWREAFER